MGFGHGFKYKGGAEINRDEQSTEKFLLFLIIGGKEVPYYELRSNNLVDQEFNDPFDGQMGSVNPAVNNPATWFTTKAEYGKLFVCQSGYGIQKKFFSFYFRFLKTNPSPIVTIKPFTGDKTGFFFRGMISFLKKRETKEILDPSSLSLKYLEEQILLPLPVLKQMVTVDRTILRKGLRQIRIKGKS